ncbi:MAG: hypothetical protein QXM31_00930 [Candidatus Woesearchaeota archaeon]
MPDRKAQLGEAVIFWIFYLFLTGAVIYVVVTIPSLIFSELTKTNNLENAVFAERIYSKASWQSPLTHRAYPGILPSKAGWDKQVISGAFTTLGTPRMLAVKLALGSDTAYYQEERYNEWVPLSPLRYKRFVETRPVWVQDTGMLELMTIDQVYAPVPPGGFR